MKFNQHAPNDPDVKIPDAVKAAAAAADSIHATAYSEDTVGETPAETLTEAPLTADPPKQEAQEYIKPKAEDNFEHRYNSMKGRFDRAQQQITSQAERIASLERVIASMQAQAQAQAQPAETREYHAERLLTPEEESDYGQEFLTVVGKKAKEELLPELRKYQDEISSLKAQLKGVGNYVAQDSLTRMTDSLDKSVPNWRETNVNPEFLSWLALPDPYSGDIRHNMLKAAWERHDGPRVAAFFTGFLAEEAATSPANSGHAPAATAGKVSLEQFAAPGRAKTAAASSAPAEKPIITSAQIAKFYADSAAGRYRGKEEEKARMEKAIFDAQREGRIR